MTPASLSRRNKVCFTIRWCEEPLTDLRLISGQTVTWVTSQHFRGRGREREQKRSTFSSLSRYSTSLVVRHQIKETGAHFNIPYFHIKEFNDFCSFWWGCDTRNFHSTGGRTIDNSPQSRISYFPFCIIPSVIIREREISKVGWRSNLQNLQDYDFTFYGRVVAMCINEPNRTSMDENEV